jgi:hypothetical protein
MRPRVTAGIFLDRIQEDIFQFQYQPKREREEGGGKPFTPGVDHLPNFAAS